LKCRTTIAFVFENPLLGDFQLVGLRELDQCRRLARDCVFLALLRRRYSCVYCRHLHVFPPLHARRSGAPVQAPRCRRPAPVSTRGIDQMCSHSRLEMRRVSHAAQPCLFRAPRKASSARVTMAPMVRPLSLACARSRRTVLGGSLSVIGTVTSETSTGA